MSASRLCRACGNFHPLKARWPTECQGHFGARPHATPAIRTDGMAETWNPADGRTYDSRSAYERAVKAAGCEIVGNDRAFAEPTAPGHRITNWGPDIARAMESQGQ
ncbi:MAG: hypothetical protein JWM33_3520 [Caulobacteraceae bacterium]|nr:hypothetical protein [Caulobacteraceae bacterium]